jgi:hypothetical protein
MNRIKFEMGKEMEKNLFNRKYTTKKIKHRLHYDVLYWGDGGRRVSKYFRSMKKAKNYANTIHNSNLLKEGDCVEIEKTWCYRQHSPRHKWCYVSYCPNQFVCVEKW